MARAGDIRRWLTAEYTVNLYRHRNFHDYDPDAPADERAVVYDQYELKVAVHCFGPDRRFYSRSRRNLARLEASFLFARQSLPRACDLADAILNEKGKRTVPAGPLFDVILAAVRNDPGLAHFDRAVGALLAACEADVAAHRKWLRDRRVAARH